MRTQSALLIAATLLFGGVIVLVLKKDNTEIVARPVVSPERIISPPHTRDPTLTQGHRINQAQGCNTLTPLYSTEGRVASAKTSIASSEESLTAAFSDIGTVVEKSSTDPTAAIALFNLASACYSGPLENKQPREKREGCPDLDISRLVQKHPIEILKRAINLGAVEAKFMYALNAPAVAEQLRQIGRPEDAAFVAQLRADAELYGTESARAGNPDAYRYMSHAYEAAEFVARDIEKAYSFALPLQYIGSIDDKKRIDDLGRKLDETQRRAARQRAFGCGTVLDPSVLRNPFW
jgi:hypothetical protein